MYRLSSIGSTVFTAIFSHDWIFCSIQTRNTVKGHGVLAVVDEIVNKGPQSNFIRHQGGFDNAKIQQTNFKGICSQPACRGTLRCHLQCPGVPRANSFFTISLEIHFEAVIKPQSKLLWVRHYGCRKLLFFSVGCRKPKKVGKHCPKASVCLHSFAYLFFIIKGHRDGGK